MANLPGEIADALVSALETPAAQAALVAAIAAGEIPLQAITIKFIESLKGNGIVGLVINALKGTIETEINAAFAAYPPETIAKLLTQLAVNEAKTLHGQP